MDTEPRRSDQPGGRATRRAVARANGLSAEKHLPREADCGIVGVAEGICHLRDGQSRCGRQLRSTHRGSRRIEGGNPGKYCSESPEGVEVGQDDPMNVKDRAYNRQNREVARRSPHWRMRSSSDDRRDNITRLERGPLGAGGCVFAARVRTQRRTGSWALAQPKDGVNTAFDREYGGVGLNPGGPVEGSVPNLAVPVA